MLHAASQQIFTAFREHHDEQRRATNNFLLTVCETASRKTCFQSASKKLSSGGLVRSRPPLAQAAGGNGPPCSLKSFENIARRRYVACLWSTLGCTFSHCALRFAAFEFIRPPPRPSTKIPKRSGSFDLALRLHRLRRAMVRYLARRNLWSLTALRL